LLGGSPPQSPGGHWLRNLLVLMILSILAWFVWKWAASTNPGYFSLDASGKLSIKNHEKPAKDKPAKSTLPSNAETIENNAFINGVARFKQNGKYGYVLKNKEVLCAAEYDEADIKFVEDRAWVSLDGKYGFVDRESGELVIPIVYDQVTRFENGFSKVEKDELKGLVNKDGVLYGLDKPLTELVKDKYFKSRYSKIGTFKPVQKGKSTQLAKVRSIDGLWGYINQEAELVVTPEYDEAQDFSMDGYAIVGKDGKLGLINSEGESILSTVWDEILPSELYNIFRLRKNQLYGFANKEGKILVNPIYEEAGLFRDGLAYVKKNNRYGFVNERGNVAIPLKYDEMQVYEQYYGFQNGKAKIRVGIRQGYVYKDGTEWWFD